MLRIRLSVTLFHKYQTCELTEKEAVYILESLRKSPDTKVQRPFVCITGYNGMAIHILEGSFENFPHYMTLNQGFAYHGHNKNIRWPILNRRLELEQIELFTNRFLNAENKKPTEKRFYQPIIIHTQNLLHAYATSAPYSEPPGNQMPSPVFEPNKWNDDLVILANNNCYTYALNIKGLRTSSGKDPNQSSLGNIIKNCLADELHIVPTVSEEDDKHLIALFASAPFSETNKTRNDYHFFRRDATGEWSHKNGLSTVSNRDFSGHIIRDVMACDLGRFQYFYCLFRVTASAVEKVSQRTQSNAVY